MSVVWLTWDYGYTAKEGVDYSLSYGTLTFERGERAKTFPVETLDDAHNNPGETFAVYLYSAKGATVTGGRAIGTILNDDPLPQAWLARFGRTLAQQALAGIADRLTAGRTPGLEGNLAGQSLAFNPWEQGPAGDETAMSGTRTPDPVLDAVQDEEAARTTARLARYSAGYGGQPLPGTSGWWGWP